MGYFTPFRDPMSPRSSWYGIYVRVVDRNAAYNKDAEHRIMTEQLFGVAEAMNLIPDDPEETLGRALVPASPWGAVAPSAPGTLELKRHYSGGAPVIYADGMVMSLVGGVVGAEAVIRGVNPDERYPPRFAALAPAQPAVGLRDQQDTVRVRHVAARKPGGCDGVPAHRRTEPMGFGRLTFGRAMRWVQRRCRSASNRDGKLG